MVRRDSPYNCVADLENSIFAYNDEQSLSGFHCVEFLLEEEKMKTHFFRKTIATGGHAKSLVAVQNGVADVCALDCCVWQHLLQTDPDKLKNIRPLSDGRLGPHPAQPIVASNRVSVEIQDRIRKAFIALSPLLLSSINAESYITVSDQDYQRIRMKLLQCKGKKLIQRCGKNSPCEEGQCKAKNKFKKKR